MNVPDSAPAVVAGPTFFPDLPLETGPIPDGGIVSRTVLKTETTKAVLFGFAEGQELSEHTSARPAIVHFLSGTARLTLGDAVHEVTAGAWAHMPPNLPHSILARSEVRMLLLLLK